MEATYKLRKFYPLNVLFSMNWGRVKRADHLGSAPGASDFLEKMDEVPLSTVGSKAGKG